MPGWTARILPLFPLRFAIEIFRELVRIADHFARPGRRCGPERRTALGPAFDPLEHSRLLSLSLLRLPLSFGHAGRLPFAGTRLIRRRLRLARGGGFGGGLRGGRLPRSDRPGGSSRRRLSPGRQGQHQRHQGSQHEERFLCGAGHVLLRQLGCAWTVRGSLVGRSQLGWLLDAHCSGQRSRSAIEENRGAVCLAFSRGNNPNRPNAKPSPGRPRPTKPSREASRYCRTGHTTSAAARLRISPELGRGRGGC